MPLQTSIRALSLGTLFLLLILSHSHHSKDASGSPAAGKGDGPTRITVDPGKKLRQEILRTVLLDHFCLGVDAPRAWQDDVRKTSGARFDFMLQYLSGGVGHDNPQPWWLKYGFIAKRADDCKANHMGAWYTWYMLSQSMPADYKPGPKFAAPANAKVASTMLAYFSWFKDTMVEINKYPDVPTVMQIEPDEWNHLLISGHMDPATVEVQVGSCGMEDLVGLPDNEIGWAQAFGVLRDKYAPNVLLACNPSGWDWQNSMSGTNMGNTFKLMCTDEFELASFETGDRDKGLQGTAPPYLDASSICGTITNHISWIRDFHKACGLWVACWQVALGNTYYTTCNNTKNHYCDNLAQYILEDYPRNDGISRYVDAGCCGFMFNGCIPGCTNVFDQAADGITHPAPIPGNEGHLAEFADDDGGFLRVFAGKYYQHPYSVYAKVVKKPVKPEKPRQVKIDASPHSATLIDPACLAVYSAALRGRISEELHANRPPSFTSSVFGSRVRITSMAGEHLTLGTEEGGAMDLTWSTLRLPDLAELAVLQIRAGHPEDRALAGFYLLLTGRFSKANDELSQSGSYEKGLRALFTIK